MTTASSHLRFGVLSCRSTTCHTASGRAGLVTVGIQSRPEERGSPGAEKVIARSGPAIWASALPFSTRRSLLPQLRTRSEAHRGRRLLSKTMLARQALSSSRQFSSRASKICEPRSLGRLTRRRFLMAPLAFPHRRQGSALQANPPPTVTDMGCSRLCREPLGPRGRCNRSCAGSPRGRDTVVVRCPALRI